MISTYIKRTYLSSHLVKFNDEDYKTVKCCNTSYILLFLSMDVNCSCLIAGDQIGIDVNSVNVNDQFVRYSVTMLGYGYMGDLLKDSDKALRELQQALRAKDASLQDAWQMASEREVEISKITAQLREAEDVAREYEGRGVNAQRMQEALDETEQVKGDFLQILNFKNELEVLIEE